jgi:hypothetical protein
MTDNALPGSDLYDDPSFPSSDSIRKPSLSAKDTGIGNIRSARAGSP